MHFFQGSGVLQGAVNCFVIEEPQENTLTLLKQSKKQSLDKEIHPRVQRHYVMKLVGVELSIYGTTETIVKTLYMVPKNLEGAKLLQPGKCQGKR